MGPHVESKCVSFCRNVECVECFGEKLEGDPWPENSTYSTCQQKECDFSKNLILSGEMLNLSNSGGLVE